MIFKHLIVAHFTKNTQNFLPLWWLCKTSYDECSAEANFFLIPFCVFFVLFCFLAFPLGPAH